MVKFGNKELWEDHWETTGGPLEDPLGTFGGALGDQLGRH